MLKILMIRIVRAVAVMALILAIPAGVFYNHTANNPQYLVVTTTPSFDETLYYEQINFAYASILNIPMSLELAENFLEIALWNDEIISDMAVVSTDASIVYIIGFYDEIDGKTTLKYDGYITYENGETIDFYKEQTFDFTLPITANEMSSSREIPEFIPQL